MLAKGHHFPHMTLAVLMDVDQGLFSGDFRATERLAQQIVQVAGRVGRGERAGRVLLQSHEPEHPLLTGLLARGYHRLAREMLGERRSNAMPPYHHLALLRCEAQHFADAEAFLSAAAAAARELAPPSPHLQYLGPIPALLERRADRYRLQLQIKSAERANLHRLLNPLLELIAKHPMASRVRWSLDVDPLDLA